MVTPLPLRSVMRRSRSSTSNAIVPPAVSLGFSLVKLVRTATWQVVFHPPLVSPVADRARLEAERLFVELARPYNVGDRVIREGDFLEHGTPFLGTIVSFYSNNSYARHKGSGTVTT